MQRSPAARSGPTEPPDPAPLAAPVPDVHCHLDLMDADPAAAVARARAVGIHPLVTIGIDVPTSRWAAGQAATLAGVYAAVAVHPNEAPTGATDEALAEIDRLARRAGVVAVGETGLDHYRTGEPGWAAQEASLRAHIAIAEATGRTLVIHDREAHDDVLRVLSDAGAPARTVFHCFSGDERMAAECARRGYAMSFAGNVTFGNAAALRAAARVVPDELLLVETDAPFLTPAPYRGRPNAPYLVPLTVRALAELRGVDELALAGVLAATARRFFDLPDGAGVT